MQSQEVCIRVGSHNSHSKTTPAAAAMGDASVSYEFKRGTQTNHEPVHIISVCQLAPHYGAV